MVSKKWLNELITKIDIAEHPSGFKYAIKSYTEEWLSVNERIKKIDKELTKQAQADNELDTIYRSVPDLGALGARILANELGDMKQFSNEKKLFSFAGLTPGEYS